MHRLLPVITALLLLAVACAAGELPTRASAAATPTIQRELTTSPGLTAYSTPTLVTPRPTATVQPTASPSPVPTATPCASPGQVISDTFPSSTAGVDQSARIYLPPCYGSDGFAYPLLYLFAGNIHDESKWDELGADEAADALISQGTSPFLVVMPDGGWLANNTSGGPGSYESLVLDDLIPYAEASYCAWSDPRGRAIGGLSRGGYWALEIAFRSPEQFTSVGGHSAALLDQYAGPSVNPQHTGISNDLGDLRVYLDIGSDDYLRTNTIRLHEEMLEAGIAHAWLLNPGRHEDAYWAEHVADYLTWYAAGWPADRDNYPPCDLLNTPEP